MCDQSSRTPLQHEFEGNQAKAVRVCEHGKQHRESASTDRQTSPGYRDIAPNLSVLLSSPEDSRLLRARGSPNQHGPLRQLPVTLGLPLA
jgi:hypothetical protein